MIIHVNTTNPIVDIKPGGHNSGTNSGTNGGGATTSGTQEEDKDTVSFTIGVSTINELGILELDLSIYIHLFIILFYDVK